VSIIVPVYGTEKYLPACIESICRQTYSDLEIILVDDQSPDKCPEICDSYAQKDSRITVIHQQNKGVSGARNTGLQHATGDYVMFLDSDDELYPEAVEILLSDSQSYEADVVSASQRIVGTNGNVISVEADGSCSVLKNEKSLLLSLAGDENTVSACAKLFNKDFLQDICFCEGKNIHEDGFFLFQCCLKEPVWVQHNVEVYQYNLRDGSNSRQRFSDKYLSMLYYCDCKKALLKEYGYQYDDQVRNMEVRTRLQLLDLLCSTTDKKYEALKNESVKLVSDLYRYHVPINNHHKKLAWIIARGLYPVYKILVRFKYYR
jgi:glycosyltransferase involved in cell wall biosynthesis